MLTLDVQKIYVFKTPIDCRKAIDGLSILVNHLNRDPQSGELFLFTNRRRHLLKGLFWHHNGFVLLTKRLEKGKYKFSSKIHEEELLLTEEQFMALLMGFDFFVLDKNYLPKFDKYC